jgi:diguanylate cyclase (GGDEF)-like protein/PAS domain S-box-containing protein
MAEAELRVLIVEDVPTDAELALRELKKAGMTCKTVRAETRADYLRHLDGFAPDIILSDFSLPHFDGMSALAIAREKCPEVPFIFVSGTIGEETAINSLKSGATDYILKSNLARLAPAVQRALQDARDSKARQEAERQVRELQERFELFMRYLPGVAFIKDPQGRYQFVNKTWEQVTGVRSDVAKGLTDHDLWSELAEQYQQSEQAVLERNEVVEALNEFPMDDGVHTFLVHRFPILDAEGRLALIGGVAVDLTERLRAEAKLSRLSRIRAVLSSINAAIVRMRDRDELYREVCRIAVHDGGFKLAWVGLLDRETLDIRPVARVGEDGGLLDRMRLSAREDMPGGRGVSGRAIRAKEPMVVNDVASDGRLAHKEDTLRCGFRSFIVLPLLVESRPVGSLYFYTPDTGFFDQEEHKLLTELAGDISFALEHIDKSEKLDYLAYYDGLTGLANRQLFSDRVNQLLQSAQREKSQVALALIDLRRFGVINNTLGRQAGDAVLKQVGQRFKSALQDLHPLARISDDTFAIALADASEAANVAHVLERQVITCLNQPFAVEGHELRLSVKCGVAIFPCDGADADILFRNAEAALKNAKDTDDAYLF